MKGKSLGYDPDLGRKFLEENDGLLIGLGANSSQEQDAEEISIDDLRDYLLDVGLPEDAQNLHDAQLILQDMKREKKREGKASGSHVLKGSIETKADGMPKKAVKSTKARRLSSSKSVHSEQQSADMFDPNTPETEEDGQRLGALRIAQYKHQSEQFRKRKTDETVTTEQLQEREKIIQEREKKRVTAIENAERDAPIRVRFHDWMERAGFRNIDIPKPGASYSGSHTETMWEAYLDATLKERESK